MKKKNELVGWVAWTPPERGAATIDGARNLRKRVIRRLCDNLLQATVDILLVIRPDLFANHLVHLRLRVRMVQIVEHELHLLHVDVPRPDVLHHGETELLRLGRIDEFLKQLLFGATVAVFKQQPEGQTPELLSHTFHCDASGPQTVEIPTHHNPRV